MNEEHKNMEETPTQETQRETVPTTPQEEIPNTLKSEEPKESALGSIVGVAIIIIILIAGGIYFWSTTVVQEESTVVKSTIEADKIVNQLGTQGTSDEIADIEADLNTTDLDNLDSELEDLLNEL